MSKKKKLDQLINTHYKILSSISGNINGKLKYELLHESILDIYDNIEVKNSFIKSDTDFLKYMTVYMSNKHKWEAANSGKRTRDTKLITYEPITDSEHIDVLQERHLIDHKSEELMILQTENINQETKDFLKDIILSGVSVERGLQFQGVMKLYDEKILNKRERFLFHQLFIDKQSVSAIFRDTKTKHTTSTHYHTLLAEVKELKIKIINIINE